MASEYKRLYRSQDDRMIAGVCGGIAEYFNVDPTLVRLLFVFGALGTVSGLFWAYLVMAVIVPEDVPASQDIVQGSAEDLDQE
ncbi:MAG: PspC domain-containing protein [Anaerolineales bacterium]|jgi:phage shock protein C